MARIHGRRGRVYVGIASDSAAAEALPYTATWSIAFATDNAEVTAFGDTVKTYVAGLPDASGAFSGFLDDATAQTYTYTDALRTTHGTSDSVLYMRIYQVSATVGNGQPLITSA